METCWREKRQTEQESQFVSWMYSRDNLESILLIVISSLRRKLSDFWYCLFSYEKDKNLNMTAQKYILPYACVNLEHIEQVRGFALD